MTYGRAVRLAPRGLYYLTKRFKSVGRLAECAAFWLVIAVGDPLYLQIKAMAFPFSRMNLAADPTNIIAGHVSRARSVHGHVLRINSDLQDVDGPP